MSDHFAPSRERSSTFFFPDLDLRPSTSSALPRNARTRNIAIT